MEALPGCTAQDYCLCWWIFLAHRCRLWTGILRGTNLVYLWKTRVFRVLFSGAVQERDTPSCIPTGSTEGESRVIRNGKWRKGVKAFKALIVEDIPSFVWICSFVHLFEYILYLEEIRWLGQQGKDFCIRNLPNACYFLVWVSSRHWN